MNLIVYWLPITILMVSLFFFMKFKEFRHKIGLIAVVLFLVFMLVSGVKVFNSGDFDLTTFDGLVESGKVYFSWLGNIAGNVAKISSNVVKQDWDIDYKNESSSGK